MEINYVHTSELRPAPWRTNHTFKPEMRVLTDSLLKHGWLQPIVAMPDGLIVDGFSRWFIAVSSKAIAKRDSGLVPVVPFHGDEIDAMVAHVRLNRARGEIIPRALSVLVRDVIRSGKYSPDELQKELRLGADEFSLLIEGTLLKVRKIADHDYSKAWVPVESNGTVAPPAFERPPNADS